jgi:2-methylisocitrate lyase-like PEP mutase family enzyme
MLRDLHAGPRPLILPNVWDPVSAKAFADAGFGVLATSSVAVAATLGYEDGAVPAGEMLAAVARIARAVDVPVTADVENGYGLAAAELVNRLADAGVVGCNLEDSDPVSKELTEPERQADYLAAVRAAAGPALVINARVDAFVYPPGPPGAGQAGAAGARLEEAVARANSYLVAGADCAYPILAPVPAYGSLVARVKGPVNVLRLPGGPTLAELAALGVARISFGGLLHRRATEGVSGLARDLAGEIALLG